jgi:hypothetical protein
MSLRFHLVQAGAVLGELAVEAPDGPYIVCAFAPTPAFERVRSLFDRELALLEANDLDAWEDAYEEIVVLGIGLAEPATGAPIDTFVIHVRGDKAWFRY